MGATEAESKNIPAYFIVLSGQGGDWLKTMKELRCDGVRSSYPIGH